MRVNFTNSNKINIDDWFEKTKEGKVLISFKGELTSEKLSFLMEETERVIAENPELSHIRKTTFHVVVECLQNLYHHGIPIDENKYKFGAYFIMYSENSLKIITGNFINAEKAQLISDRICQINSMSNDELKKLYKLILRNEEFSEKGGGGLGMIDIAKRTGSKLMFEFLPFNEKVFFYVLKINII